MSLTTDEIPTSIEDVYIGERQDEFSEEIRKSREILIFNVGGTQFHVLKSNFASWPKTRLSRLVRARDEDEILQLCDGFVFHDHCKVAQKEFYFNRNWSTFNSILDIYRNGKLHGLNTACAITFHDDLQYWGIDELFLDPCCALKYYPEKDTCTKEVAGDQLSKVREEQRRKDENFGTSWVARARKYLWNLTEYPETSKAARVSNCVKRAKHD